MTKTVSVKHIVLLVFALAIIGSLIVIMKGVNIQTPNALSGIKEINLPKYAERFAEAGFATVIFDYRYWGESSGKPRFYVAPMEFRTDISAALTFLARQLLFLLHAARMWPMLQNPSSAQLYIRRDKRWGSVCER
jgi:hypothetical protein